MAPELLEASKEIIDTRSSYDVPLYCRVHANPPANIQWFKGITPIKEDSNHTISGNITTNCTCQDRCKSSEIACISYSKLELLYVEPDDDGNYTCEASNNIEPPLAKKI